MVPLNKKTSSSQKIIPKYHNVFVPRIQNSTNVYSSWSLRSLIASPTLSSKHQMISQWSTQHNATKRGVPRIWSKCLNVPSLAMLHHVQLCVTRITDCSPTDFDECFCSCTAKCSHPSEVTQWSECVGRRYEKALIINVQLKTSDWSINRIFIL